LEANERSSKKIPTAHILLPLFQKNAKNISKFVATIANIADLKFSSSQRYCESNIVSYLMKTKHLLIAPVISCLLVSSHAATVSYSFDTIFSDNPVAPAAAAPWLLMSTTDTGTPKEVSLTFSAINLTDPEYVRYINADPSLDLTLLTFSLTSTTGSFTAPSIGKAHNGHIADSGGLYDIHLAFSNSNSGGGIERFTDNDSLTYTVSYSGAGAFDSSSFSFIGTPNEQTLYGPYYSAARILSTGVDTLGGAWVAPVPEPSATLYSLMALGLTLGLRRKR
jgi:hypothetical protein